jgi:hypothetical protein
MEDGQALNSLWPMEGGRRASVSSLTDEELFAVWEHLDGLGMISPETYNRHLGDDAYQNATLSPEMGYLEREMLRRGLLE